MSKRSRTVSRACRARSRERRCVSMNLAVTGNRRSSGYHVSKSRPFSLKHAARNVVVDEAEVVLDEGEEHVREDHVRLLPQLLQVDFVQRDVAHLVQEQQVGEEVTHERGQVQRGRTRLIDTTAPLAET